MRGRSRFVGGVRAASRYREQGREGSVRSVRLRGRPGITDFASFSCSMLTLLSPLLLADRSFALSRLLPEPCSNRMSPVRLPYFCLTSPASFSPLFLFPEALGRC